MKPVIKDFLGFLEERFGLQKEAFSGFSFYEGPDKIYIFSQDLPSKDLAGLKIVQTGIVAGRVFGDRERFKPTTNLLQIFGRFATRNFVELEESEKEDFIRGLDIDGVFEVDEGFVIVKFREDVLGCGLYSGGKLKNQIPKSRRLALR